MLENRTVPELRKEPNGFYYAFWSEGRRSRRKSMGAKDQAVATARFAQWLLIDGAGKGDEVAYTVADCWTVYDAKHVQTDAVMPNGRKTIASAWKHVGPVLGALLVAQVDQAAVDGYVARRQREGAAPATIRREVAQVLAAINFCATSKGGKIVNKADIEDIDLPVNSPPRDRWLTMDEVQALLSAAASYRGQDGRLTRYERFLWLALFTAARHEALLQLTWDRVDFQTNTIHLNVPGRRITKKRRADVIIATQLRPILERAYSERITDPKKNPGNLVLDNRHVIFPALQGIAVRAGLAERRVNKHGKQLATGIGPHVLRHTAATHMARNKVPMWMIANILGDTIQTTSRVYAKWVPENAAGTVDLISGGVLETTE